MLIFRSCRIGWSEGKSGKPSILIASNLQLWIGNPTDEDTNYASQELLGFGVGAFEEKVVSDLYRLMKQICLLLISPNHALMGFMPHAITPPTFLLLALLWPGLNLCRRPGRREQCAPVLLQVRFGPHQLPEETASAMRLSPIPGHREGFG